MTEFKIKIAGQVAAVSSLFESTRDYCRLYLTQENPDYTVSVTKSDLEFEQEWLAEEARLEGFRLRIFSDPFLERAAIQRKVAEHLFDYDTLLFHGSAVAVDGTGYLFTAKSGTGKSTHTRLWREVFGDRAVMINDDKPFLRIADSGVLVCGSPWSGKHGLDANITVPLKGICILERGRENHIRKIEQPEAMEMLRKQSSQPLEPTRLPKFQALVDTLGAKVPLWHMECNKDPQAATVSFAAMSGIKCTILHPPFQPNDYNINGNMLQFFEKS